MNSYRILLVDDHPLLRAGLRQVITSDPRFVVVGESSAGDEALRMASELRPDILILDVDLPGMDGMTVMRELQARGLQMPVVVLTMHKRESLLNEAIDLGASGFVLKDNAVTDLLEALRATARGERWYSPSLSNLLLRRNQRRRRLEETQPTLSALTPTERRVLRLVGENLTSREIASRLGISLLTVETHRRNICRKLGLEGSHPLLLFALKHVSELADA